MKLGIASAVLLVAGLAAALVGFGAYASARLPGSFGGTPWIWVAMVGGVLTTAALTAGFIWLAFHSARHGYDDAAAAALEEMGEE